jgi:hypothetical protein
MKRRIVAVAVAAVGLLAIMAGTANAQQATHFMGSFSAEHLFPAGTLCDFTYHQVFTGDVIVTISPKGEIDKVTVNVTHTNVDTGYTLTEVDQNTSLQPPGSPTAMTVGISWHLRDASGKNVLVKAGKATFDSAGDLVKFTPNSGFDQTFAGTICPLLGGSPA